MKQALVLVDIQNDYFPGGRMELVGSEAAGIKAGILLKRFRDKGLPVFHVQHFSVQPGATFFLPETEGVQIHQCVKPLPTELVVKKNFPNSFRNTELQGKLMEQGITQLVICGMMSHMCIDTTVRAAFDLGFSCILAHDACATRDLSFGNRVLPAADVHAAFMAALGMVFATVTDVDSVPV